MTASARHVGELVQELANTGGLATLHLRSGRDVHGVVKELVRGRQENTVIIARDDGATYVTFASIEAVTAHGMSTEVKEPPPTRLAARRLLEEHARRIATTLEVDVALETPVDTVEPGEATRGLVDLAFDVATALSAAARDAMGRTAISARLRRVVLADDATAKVSLDGDTLRFTAPLVDGAACRLGAAELQAAVEALF